MSRKSDQERRNSRSNSGNTVYRLLSYVVWNKPIETIWGMPARVICTNRKCSHGRFFVVLAQNNRGDETTMTVDKKGKNDTGLKVIHNVGDKRYPPGTYVKDFVDLADHLKEKGVEVEFHSKSKDQ